VSKWLRKVLNLKDITHLYIEKKGHWLLLEILETTSDDKPIKFRLLDFSADKDKLHDYISEDETWNWDKKYLMVLADPNKPCTL